MGLFDMDGGFDLSALGDFLNPIGTANAAGGPTQVVPPELLGGLNKDALLNSPQAQAMRDAAAGGGVGVGPTGPALPDNLPITPAIRSMTAGGPPPAVPPVVPSPVVATPAPTPVTAAPAPPPSLGRGTSDTGLPPDVGAALTGKTEGTSGATDISARAKTPEKPGLAQGLAGALKGIQAMKPPEVQKIQSPAAPRATGTIKGGDLQALLMALNAGAPLGSRLPISLGSTLGRGYNG